MAQTADQRSTDDASVSQVAQTAELALDFPQERARQRAERTNEPCVVDGAALVDHDFTVFPVPGDTSGKRHTQEVFPGKASGARQHPGRRVPYFVEEVRLDHEHGPNLSGLAAPARVEIGQVEGSSPDLHIPLL